MGDYWLRRKGNDRTPLRPGHDRERGDLCRLGWLNVEFPSFYYWLWLVGGILMEEEIFNTPFWDPHGGGVLMEEDLVQWAARTHKLRGLAIHKHNHVVSMIASTILCIFPPPGACCAVSRTVSPCRVSTT